LKVKIFFGVSLACDMRTDLAFNVKEADNALLNLQRAGISLPFAPGALKDDTSDEGQYER
jgi:hypothetical protein